MLSDAGMLKVTPRSAASAMLFASLVLLPSGVLAKERTQPPAPTLPMVSLSPGPGVTFQIPEIWIACNDDTEKLLHSANDALNIKAKFCALSSNVPSVMRAFDPRPLHTLSVIFNYHAHQPISEQALGAIAPADLDAIHDAICAVEIKPLEEHGNKTLSCEVTLGTLGGHRALVSTLVESNPEDPKYNIIIHSYEVAYPQGYMQIQFSHPALIEKIIKPQLDAIIASVQISSAGTPADDVASPAPDGGSPPPKDTPDAPPPRSTPDTSI